MRKRTFPRFEDALSSEPLINLTPLIDVVFVVLISFILIAPLLKIDSIDLAPGSRVNQTAPSSMQNDDLTIYIRADNSIWLHNQHHRLETLEKALLTEKKHLPNAIPKMIPDARSHFETYCKVKNILQACGFEHVDLVLKEE